MIPPLDIEHHFNGQQLGSFIQWAISDTNYLKRHVNLARFILRSEFGHAIGRLRVVGGRSLTRNLINRLVMEWGTVIKLTNFEFPPRVELL